MSQENKAIVEQMNKAAAEGNTDAFVEPCAEDIRWTVFGEKTVEGSLQIYFLRGGKNVSRAMESIP